MKAEALLHLRGRRGKEAVNTIRSKSVFLRVKAAREIISRVVVVRQQHDCRPLLILRALPLVLVGEEARVHSLESGVGSGGSA